MKRILSLTLILITFTMTASAKIDYAAECQACNESAWDTYQACLYFDPPDPGDRWCWNTFQDAKGDCQTQYCVYIIAKKKDDRAFDKMFPMLRIRRGEVL